MQDREVSELLSSNRTLVVQTQATQISRMQDSQSTICRPSCLPIFVVVGKRLAVYWNYAGAVRPKPMKMSQVYINLSGRCVGCNMSICCRLDEKSHRFYRDSSRNRSCCTVSEVDDLGVGCCICEM